LSHKIYKKTNIKNILNNPLNPIIIQFSLIATILLFTINIQNTKASSISNEIDSFLDNVGIVKNSTSAKSWSNNTAEYYSLGGFSARTGIKSINPVSIRLPEFRAGCGGIDIFNGGFSFINEDQFIAMGKKIAANATGFAAKMGLALICPMCEKTMSELQELANKINSADINSCEMAQSALGSLASLNSSTSSAFCKTKGNYSGLFSDYAAARAGCDNENQAKDTSYTKEEKNAGAGPYNLTWKILTDNEPTNDQNLIAYYELLMTLTGTIIYNQAAPSTNSIKGKITDENIQVLLEGGEIEVLSCNDNTTDCLETKSSTVTIDDTTAFRPRVNRLIASIRDKIIEETKDSNSNVSFTNEESEFLTNAPYGLPIYKIIETQQAYKKFSGIFSLDGLEDYIALGLLLDFLKKMNNEVLSKAALSSNVTTEQKDQIIGNLKIISTKLNQRLVKIEQKVKNLSNQLKNIKYLEKYVSEKSIFQGIGS